MMDCSREVVTMFERMRGIGYTTGAIGKWHVGALPDIVSGTTIIKEGNRPPRQGVDEFFGILKGSRNYSRRWRFGDVGRLAHDVSRRHMVSK